MYTSSPKTAFPATTATTPPTPAAPAEPVPVEGEELEAVSATPSNELVPLRQEPTSALALPATVDPYSSMSAVDRSLLDHFTNVASRVISCHPVVQNDIRHLIIPAALENSGLFHATMALSAIHQKSLGCLAIDAAQADKLIFHFIGNSLRSLRQDLQQRDPSKCTALLATIRTLFLCDVHTGGDRPGTWRAHFEGAKALMQTVESWDGQSFSNRNNTPFFLRRWYNNTESLVALTADGLSRGQLARFSSHPLLEDVLDSQVYLDEYTGFSTDLHSVFQEIGAAAWECHKQEADPSWQSVLSQEDLDNEAAHLGKTVQSMIERDLTQTPCFHPDLEEKLSSQQIQDFRFSNEAYQQMALIHIHRKISRQPASSPAVQNAVKRTLQCIDAITPTAGLSPLVVLTTPLFTAGCEALEEDRDTVRTLFRRMFELLRIPNMQRSLEVLETFWTEQGNETELDWDTFMRRNNWDFLAY